MKKGIEKGVGNFGGFSSDHRWHSIEQSINVSSNFVDVRKLVGGGKIQY